MNATASLHRQPIASLAELARVERRAVLLFAETAERHLYRSLGYSSMIAYAREALGFSDARFYQFQRLAESFKALPELKRAVAAGELGWTLARVVSRVARPETRKA